MVKKYKKTKKPNIRRLSGAVVPGIEMKTKKPNIRRLSGAVVPGIEIKGYKKKKPKRRAPGK